MWRAGGGDMDRHVEFGERIGVHVRTQGCTDDRWEEVTHDKVLLSAPTNKDNDAIYTVIDLKMRDRHRGRALWYRQSNTDTVQAQADKG